MTKAKRKIGLLIVAAGRGERIGNPEKGPKQYRKLAHQAIIAHTYQALRHYNEIETYTFVIHRDDEALFQNAMAHMDNSRYNVVIGGATRQDSVRLGLQALEHYGLTHVLIHDGVRPFVSKTMMHKIFNALNDETGVLPALSVTDTLKRVQNGLVSETVNRAQLYAAQTPQAFPYQTILQAHNNAAAQLELTLTDDVALFEWANFKTRIIDGDIENIKITYQDDLARAERRIIALTQFPDIRTGNGYDTHCFEPGDGVILCGIKIPFDKKLKGHSDADVALHALTDALLATRGAGDIGTHFPPSDPQWRGAPSHIFITHAVKLIREHGGRISNVDITIIAEAPKIGPHRDAMTSALQEMLGIEPNRISIKATTNEKMGFIGREEGMCAIATASVIYPGEVPL